MTKAQREKAERLLLKQMIDTKPKYKEILDAMIENPNPELKDIINPVIEEKLKEARMIGCIMGFQGAMIVADNHIKDMDSIEEIKAYVHEEATKVREKLNLKGEM